MGVSTMKLNDMLENGEVLAEDLLPKLAEVLENRFGDAAVDASSRAQAAFNELSNALTNLQRSWGEAGLTDWIADLARNAAKLADSLGDIFKEATPTEQLQNALSSVEQRLNKLNGVISESDRVFWQQQQSSAELANQLFTLDKPLQLLNKDISSMTEEQLKQYKASLQSSLALYELGKAFREAEEEAEPLLNTYKGVGEFLELEAKNIKELNKEISLFGADDIAKAEAAEIASVKKQAEELKKAANEKIKLKSNVAEVEAEIEKNLADQITKIRQEAAEKRKKEWELGNKQYNKIIENQIKAEEKLKDWISKNNQDINDEKEKIRKKWLKTIDKYTKEEQDLELQSLEKVYDDYVAAYGFRLDIYQNYLRAKNALMNEYSEKESKKREQEAKKMQGAYDDLFDDVRDWTRDIIDNFDNMGDSLVDIAENIVKDIAATFLAQKVVMPITLAMGGALGLSQGGYSYGQLNGEAAGGMTGGGYNLPSANSLSWVGNNVPGMSWINNALAAPMPGTAVTGALGGSFGPTAGMAGGNSALAAQTAITNGVSLSTALGYGGWGGLGYTYLGGMLGLPQSKYSGLTAGIGGALGGTYAGSIAGGVGSGVAGGASAGSIVPVVGTIVGAIIGGLAGSFLGSSKKVPDVRIGSVEGGYLSPSTHDVSGSENRRSLESSVEEYFDLRFQEMDAMLNASIEDAITSGSFRGRIRLDKLDENDPNSLFSSLIESAWTDAEIVPGMSGNLREILLNAIGLDVDSFSDEFFKSIQGSGEDLLQTFTNFAFVVENTF